MEKKIRENAVYISLLPDDVTEGQIQDLFGSIGVIKVCGVYTLIYAALFCVAIVIEEICFHIRPTKKLEDQVLTFITTSELEFSK